MAMTPEKRSTSILRSTLLISQRLLASAQAVDESSAQLRYGQEWKAWVQLEKAGLSFSFATSHVGGEHPNTARVDLVGRSGKTLSMTGSSLGGGRIMVVEMNGLRANFSGDLPTLIVQNIDQPGHVNEVTGMLTERGINIATMQLYRDHPGGNAVMIIETDKAVPPDGLAWLERCEGITRVTFIDAEREE